MRMSEQHPNKNKSKTNDIGAPDVVGIVNDDILQPFLLEKSNIRGRMVRLGPALNDILAAHHDPVTVSRVLAEALTLTTLLAGMLKFDGVFTLQMKGDGAIPTLVCDMTNNGFLRGYAGYDLEKLRQIRQNHTGDDHILPKDLIGKGYLAFTVDQKEVTERYQGLVELTGDKVVDCVQHYFKQSEQIKVGIKVFAQRDDQGQWHGGAVMLQELPEQDSLKTASDLEDDWRRCMMLLDTATATEMLDPKLPINTMIYRLFHEENVRVFETVRIQKGCRCSRAKIVNVLKTLKGEDVEEFMIDGKVSITCEFCNTSYDFIDNDLKEFSSD